MESLRRLFCRHCDGGEFERGLSDSKVKQRVAIVLADMVAKWMNGRVGNSSANLSERVVVTAENVCFDQMLVMLGDFQKAVVGMQQAVLEGPAGTPVVTIEDVPGDAKHIAAFRVSLE